MWSPAAKEKISLEAGAFYLADQPLKLYGAGNSLAPLTPQRQ